MIGRIFIFASALLLCVFLSTPDTFAPIFEPFTNNGAQAIYRQTSLLYLTVSHLSIVFIAVVASTIIAVASGILVTRPAGQDFLPLARTITSIGQTIPPVAVLALLVPALGFGTGPTLISLFLYGLLPIFENTLTGLQNISPNVVEAARGMGYTGWQRLLRIELPLALPAILTGIRLTSVISLATATLGSTIAAKTLGEVIIAGLVQYNTSFVLQGGLVVGLLAVLINEIFNSFERTVSRRVGSETEPQKVTHRGKHGG